MIVVEIICQKINQELKNGKHKKYGSGANMKKMDDSRFLTEL